MKIDFVSGVSCPWRVIGLGALEQALLRPREMFEPGSPQIAAHSVAAAA